MEIASSSPESIGLEIEFQLLDPETLDLTDGIVPLLEACHGYPNLEPEFAQSMVEIASNPCDSVAALEADVGEHFRYLTEQVEPLDLRLCAAGTHPFYQGWAEVTPDRRFERMAEAAGFVAHYDVTFATHVHVGVGTRGDLVELMRGLRRCLPVLAALSANSPFWRGHSSGYASFRHIALRMARSYGLPPRFETWDELESFFEQVRRTGIAESVKDLHWDVRPRPDLGTVEVRTMDACSTLEESLGFAAFIRALADDCRDSDSDDWPDWLPAPVPRWLEKENFFQASRGGLEGRCVDREGDAVEWREPVERALESVWPCVEHRGNEGYLEPVRELVDRPGYRRQLEIYEKTRSLEAVTRHLAELLRD